MGVVVHEMIAVRGRMDHDAPVGGARMQERDALRGPLVGARPDHQDRVHGHEPADVHRRRRDLPAVTRNHDRTAGWVGLDRDRDLRVVVVRELGGTGEPWVGDDDLRVDLCSRLRRRRCRRAARHDEPHDDQPDDHDAEQHEPDRPPALRAPAAW